MAYASDRKKGVPNYPNLGPDDYLSDELPDYSSRRSSFYGGDFKPNPFDPEPDRNRRISTASNTLEVPGYSFFERQNSVGSMNSLVSDTSNNSNNTFSYRNLNKPKIKNAFGSLIVLIGLSFLVLGILFLIFGHNTGLSISNINDQSYNPNINYNNNSSTNNSRSNITTETTTPISDINNNNQNKNGYHVSAIETIGYFALFSGILLILIGISIICMSVKEIKKPNPSPQNPIRDFRRRVSTIEVEPLPQITSNGVSINKPEITITTDNLKDKVTYTKYPMPIPQPIPVVGPTISAEDMFTNSSPKSPNEYQKKFQF